MSSLNIRTKSNVQVSSPLNPFNSSPSNKHNFFQRIIIRYRLSISQRYRYFSYFILILIGLALFQGIFTILGSIFLWNEQFVLFEKQTYEPKPYLGLDSNVSDELPKGTTIYHVSREFGPVTFGDMGQMVTSLVQAQANNGSTVVNVIIPYYSYLNDMKMIYAIKTFVQLEIQVQDSHGKWQSVKLLVHRFLWEIKDNPNVVSSEPLPSRTIQVYLIEAPLDVHPLKSAFKADDISEIYTPSYSLPQDWEDIYFCKAAAEFITYLNLDIDTPLFASTETRGVDIVHVHGSSNALVIEFIKSLHVESKFRKVLPPAIVYTLHDYIEEQLYSNAIVNVQKFLDLGDYYESKESQYFRGNQMYMSAIAIDRAQIVTFVSNLIAQEMVEGPLDFYAKELIIPSILKRATEGEWIGITSGLDFTLFNPFNNTLLIETNSNFPRNIYNFDATLLYEKGSSSSQSLITTSKLNAKMHLIREGLLSSEDLNRAIVLFIGNFQYNKGLEFFQAATELLVSRNAKFIIMGIMGQSNNNYPINSLKQLAKDYPDNVLIIDDVQSFKDLGILYRAAADILFVPSKIESFGLTAAEGLLFGCPIVSTGVGVLKEFLVNKTSINMENGYNSYLFNLIDEKNIKLSIDEMKTALNNSLNDLTRLNKNLIEKEIFIRNLIKEALRLGWDRPGGPVGMYTKVYRKALLKLRKDLDVVEQSFR